MWEKIISGAATFAAAAITALINYIKKKLSVKARVRVEEIAIVVEALYDGCPSSVKLKAFETLCKEKGLNIKKSVKTLEKDIIPISKKINVYTGKEQQKEYEKGVTN